MSDRQFVQPDPTLAANIPGTAAVDPPDIPAASASVRFRRLGKSGFALVFLVAMLFLQSDSLFLTPGKANAAPYLFSFVGYEISTLPDKWVHWIFELRPGHRPQREERLAMVDEYLLTVRRLHKEEARIEGLLESRSAIPGTSASKVSSISTEYLDELKATRNRLRPEAEEALEAEISAVLVEQGFGMALGLIWPPVDIRLDSTPTLLVTSPRDEIRLQGTVVMQTGLRPFEKDELEREIEEEHDVSALVVNLGGIGTYPALVLDRNTLRTVARVAAHEWLHNHWFFKPLGWNYLDSAVMTTLNETAADLAGREIGDMAFERMGGDLDEMSFSFQSSQAANPQIAEFLRETRHRADELLAEGRVEEAEQYMRERQWRLRLGGYGIRKLNQAFFAFFNQYGESAASVSPIGGEVRELRELLPDVGTFSRVISEVSSYEEFLEVLEKHRQRGK